MNCYTYLLDACTWFLTYITLIYCHYFPHEYMSIYSLVWLVKMRIYLRLYRKSRLRMASLNMARVSGLAFTSSRCSCYVEFLNKPHYFALRIKLCRINSQTISLQCMPEDSALLKMVNYKRSGDQYVFRLPR